MTFNKRAEAKIGTVLIWIAVIGVIAYVANFGGFQNTVNGFLGGTGTTPTPSDSGTTLTDTKDCPTDGTTTYTINVQDALATTASSLYPEYYVFNGNQLIKEGTLSSTASTVSLSCGKDYQVLLVNTTAGNGGALYSKVIDLKARIAQQTINVQLTKAGEAKIYKIINPLEGAGSAYYNNMSIGKSTTKSFDIQFNANYTARGFNQPIIMCQANVTEVQTIGLTAFSDGSKPVAVTTLPKRISATGGYQYYAWEYPKTLDPTMPIVTGQGSLTTTTTGPVAAATSYMRCILIDQATWKLAQYKSATSIDTGFKTGPENTETNADVGAPDSSTATLYFVNDNGV